MDWDELLASLTVRLKLLERWRAISAPPEIEKAPDDLKPGLLVEPDPMPDPTSIDKPAK